MIKYAIHPGPVDGFDGDVHHIGYQQLIRLYGLDPKECCDWSKAQNRLGHRTVIRHLYPRASGHYSLTDK